MKRVRLGDLRKAKLPPAKPDEDPVLASLRANVESHRSDKLRLAVPDRMVELVEQLSTDTKAEQPPKKPATK
jgi:hypothetical protein